MNDNTLPLKDQIINEIMMLARGFVGAVLAGAATAALTFIGAHIPDVMHFIAMAAGGYAGVKTAQ